MGRASTVTSRARSRWRELPRWVRWPVLAGAALGALGVVALAILWVTVDLPAEPPEIQSAVVVGADGRELAVLSQDGQRFEVPLAKMAPVVVDALISAEDRRFYEHGGVDPTGIARALWRNVTTDRTQGGSTITQQLVKNEYLTSERSLWRKAREAVLSVKLERSEDKDHILERYLNTVYFGRGAYGIEAAARIYFDSSASKLTVEQAALLIGLLRSPETADPNEHMDVAMKRRAVVLKDLVETGHLSQADYERAKATPIQTTAATRPVTLTAGMAPHFVEWVRQQAIAEVGEDTVYGAGLKIVTTLDLDAQAAAEKAVAETLTDPAGPQAALVALDSDGAIRAHVGGRDFNALQVDLARGQDGGGSGRQPGSAFKPFVLEAALGQGITLGDRYSAPPRIKVDVDGQPWEVENYAGESFGEMTVADATAHSVNTVYAQMLAEVGPKAVVEAANRTGIDAELEAVPSIALGAEEVSPMDLASAYLTFADDGSRVEPYAISRIEDGKGNVLWEHHEEAPKDAVNPEIARAVTSALEGVVKSGTGTAADIGRPQAGKTGTTQDNVDAWFAGYVPGYATVVWMGYPDASKPMTDVQGRSVTGGSFPAQIWARYMEVAMKGRDVSDFPAPPKDLLRKGTEASLTVPSSPTSSSSTSSSSTTSSTESTTTTTEKDKGKGTTSSTSPTSTSSTTTSTTAGGGASGAAADP